MKVDNILGVLALVFLIWASPAQANGLLDGQSFTGVIGPAESPDLDDTLKVDDGYFWSDICTQCGFVPGPYTAQETTAGVRFTGVLESDSRGRFSYDGLVKPDGSIDVRINWERKRWYWTSRREIVFLGTLRADEDASLVAIREQMARMDPSSNPLCARF